MSASKTFSTLDHHLWWLTFRWAKRRHPNKSRTWVASRYFGSMFNKARQTDAADPDTAPAQRRVHPRGTVGGTGPVVNVDDLGHKRPVDLLPVSGFGLAGQPAVERRRRDTEDPEYRLDPETGHEDQPRSS